MEIPPSSDCLDRGGPGEALAPPGWGAVGGGFSRLGWIWLFVGRGALAVVGAIGGSEGGGGGAAAPLPRSAGTLRCGPGGAAGAGPLRLLPSEIQIAAPMPLIARKSPKIVLILPAPGVPVNNK